MISNKLITLFSVLVIGTTLLTSVAFANTVSSQMSVSINESGKTQLKGSVLSVNSANSTMVVSSFGGSWTVNALNATVKTNSESSIVFSDVKVGDTVVVSGTASQTATVITATSIMVKKPANPNIRTILGSVVGINVSAGTFTINPLFTLFGNHSPVNVKIDASTKMTLNGNTTAFGSLQNGNSVLVAGAWDASANLLTATSIKATTKVVNKEQGWDKGLLGKIGLKLGFGHKDK